MQFETPLAPARLVQRYKRFLADVTLEDGRAATAHCANSGSMMGLTTPGARVWLSPNRNPKARLAWRWELVEADGALVGINTARPNRIVEEAILNGALAALRGYAGLRREVAYGAGSRIDLLLEGPRPCFVEVKNVTLRRGEAAEFPDAVTTRGAKHLAELARQAQAGARAVMLYLVQRADCAYLSIARDIDPAYGAALADARAAGVEVLSYWCRMSVDEIAIAGTMAQKL
ncbi:MAG: DNA/RNA nuclease SfsA [Pseudomonadota bacterium]